MIENQLAIQGVPLDIMFNTIVMSLHQEGYTQLQSFKLN